MIQKFHCCVYTPPNKNMNLKRYMHSNVHCSVIYNCQVWKQLKYPSSDMEKDDAIYTYKHKHTQYYSTTKQEWNSAICHYVDEPRAYSVQFSPVSQSCPTLCNPMNSTMPGLPVHHQLPKFTQTHVHRVSDAIQPSHPLLSPSPPAPNPSQHRSLFQWVNSLHEVAKVLEFQLEHHSFQRTLISFRMDWLYLLAVQGTLKSLLQHHSSKASILRCPAFFIVQLSHPYMITGKTIALTRQIFVG